MRRLLTLLTLLLPLGIIAAQGTDDTLPANEASILSPPAVSLLRGTVEIIGTVDLPNSVGYFVQIRPLEDTLEPVGGEDALWSPATLPARGTVVDDLLGEWDTALVEDGLYELELVVTLADGETVRTRVSPVRVANEPLLFAGARFLGDGATVALATPAAPPTATARANAPVTPVVQATPDVVTVTATIQANIRLGDSTTYPALGFLNVGDSLEAVGRSTRSTWIQVELANGDLGFMSPSTVRVDGDLNDLPLVNPPPLPVTPTPVPTATPVAVANLVFDGFRVDPNPPVCGETFTVRATVRNAGTGPSGAETVVTLTDIHAPSGTQVEDTAGSIPALNPGATFEAVLQVTVTAFFEETHRITLRADSINAIQETNEGDNVLTFDYTLQKGDCG